MKKEKYLQIFNYLKEFSKLRSNPVRDIEVQETQYPEKFWLCDIPDVEPFENVIRPDFNDDNEYWLKIKKPKEPVQPKFAQLPRNLVNWVELSSLTNDEEEPKLKESIDHNGGILSLEDYPKISEEFKEYINQKWIDDLLVYNDKIEVYNKDYAIFARLNDVYKSLFRIYNKTHQFGEEYELVIGVGLLNFKEDADRPKIFRHIMTQRVDINFEYSQKDSHIIVSPNLESSLQIETDSILDLTEQFDTQNIIDAEKAVENYIIEKGVEALFGDIDISDALQMFAEQVSPEGNYLEIKEKPNTVNSKPVISYSPALLLRKRNTRSFTALYEKILEDIENETDDVDIPAIDDLIGVHESYAAESLSEDSNSQIDIEPIYFPKEYNDEQIEIIEKAKRRTKVLVQGPPGTGKSHTIANLICHLLANGKKVLVTAYTRRALEVLKDKLPPEFQDLAVNLLSGDSSAIQDLQSSVNAINDELSRANLDFYLSEIATFDGVLKKERAKIATKTNELIAIKEKATRRHEINSEYIGTLTEVAEKLESDSPTFDWYQDSFDNVHNNQIISDLESFLELREKYKQIDVSEFAFDIPEIEKLPTVNQIREIKEVANATLQYYNSKAEHIVIKSSDFEELKLILDRLGNLYKKADNLQIDFSETIIDSYLTGQTHHWNQTLHNSNLVLENIEKIDLRKIDNDIEVSYPKDKSLKQLKRDAQTLYSYLKEGNQLAGLAFAIKKNFLSKEIKERLYFIDAVKVNGSPCDTLEEFEIVLNDISIRQSLNELSELWSREIPKRNGYTKKFDYYINIHSEVSKLMVLIDEVNEICKKVESSANMSVKAFDQEFLNDLISEVEYNYLLLKGRINKEIISGAEAYLNQKHYHKVKENILACFKQFDFHTYDQLLQKIITLNDAKINYDNYKVVRNTIEGILPNLLRLIESDLFSNKDLLKFQKAILYRHAQSVINKLMDVDYERILFEDIDKLKNTERKYISRLASKKAWYHVVEQLKRNRSLRQHLDAWVLAVKKIGKTGKGKRALKFRKIAQQEMENCKDSVPCWIMPLYKVAETIRPEREMYDYVIIDEASQLGPDAIFLLYISKNIIIVGDDKQTSPEYVGVDANSMNPHIKRHLNGIPRSDFFGTEFSFFDHARFFCDGVTVLREHFRCMPEIIEFSNKYFYAPEGNQLYPLKQYSENRLKPLERIFCANGNTEGVGARIINEPEANKIVETIARLLLDNRYNDKSFGVITLQGNQQASLIESLLLKQIGEREFHKRKIVCGNSASFQGDERDVMFLSLVTAHNHNRAALVKPEDERRFNVAVSRAKEQIWLFHSVQLDDLSNTNDLRYKLLDHFVNQNSKQLIQNIPIKREMGKQPEPFESWFEVDVYNQIVNKGLSVIPQYEVAKGKYRIDLVAIFHDGTKIAIECDGDKWHGPEEYKNDILRQRVLERCGWQFFRVRGYEYYTNRTKALEPLWELIPKVEDNESDQSALRNESVYQHESQETSTNLSESTPVYAENSIGHAQSQAINKNQSPPSSDKIIRYLNIYTSGNYVLTEKDPLEANFVIPIKSYQRKGYLLQCYGSGHINKVRVEALLSKKIGKQYMNGLNKNDKLIYYPLIDSDQIIGIYFIENGRKKFKAHYTEKIPSRELLQLQGYKVLYNDFQSVEYKIYPLELANDISRLIFNSFTANGKPIDNSYYDNEWKIIRQHSLKSTDKIVIKHLKELERDDDEGKDDVGNENRDGSRVELFSIVKLLNLDTKKEISFQLVNYHVGSFLKSNEVQKININSPLASKLIGKAVGEKVGFNNSNVSFEILEIN